MGWGKAEPLVLPCGPGAGQAVCGLCLPSQEQGLQSAPVLDYRLDFSKRSCSSRGGPEKGCECSPEDAPVTEFWTSPQEPLVTHSRERQECAGSFVI